MKTPQEKIDEIHAILVKWESRRKWKNIFSWAYRLIVIGFLILVVFFPNVLFGFLVQIFTPIIENAVHQAVEAQKQNISNF